MAVSVLIYHKKGTAGEVKLTKETTTATSSQPEFFKTTNLAYTLVPTHKVASTRNITLIMIAVSPRGFELDISNTLKVFGTK